MKATGPAGWGAVLCAWASGLAFYITAGGQPIVFAALLALLLGGLARGRLHISRPLLGVAAVVCLGLTLPWTNKGDFVALSFFKLTLGLAFFTAVMLIRRHTRPEEIGVYWAGIVLGICSLSTFQASVTDLAVPVGISSMAMALGLRARVPGARFSVAALLTLFPALLAAGALAWTLRWSETKVNQLMSLLSPNMSATFDFAQDSRLTSMLQAQHNPLIVARYFSATPPTHLVGRCYLTYQNSTWSGPREKVDIQGAPNGALWNYTVATPSAAATAEEKLELPGQGKTLFAPRDITVLSAGAPGLKQAYGGILESAVDFGNFYMLTRQPNAFLAPALTQGDQPAHLQLPPDLDPVVYQLAREWSEGARDDLERAKKLESALQTKIEYGFGYPFAADKDPVPEFLIKKPPAHCELFASSLALMLRTLHIPCRYVNGFLVKERSPSGYYSIVRGQDAHAWVEAYIDDHWVHLDPTPPQAIPPRDDFRSWCSGVWEMLIYYFGRFTRLNLAEALAMVVAFLRRFGPWLAALGVLHIAWRYRPAARARRTAKAAPPRIEQLPGWLAEVERACGSPRAGHQTLLEWAAAVENDPALRDFLYDYCQVRYGKSEPAADDLERLQAAKEALTAPKPP